MPAKIIQKKTFISHPWTNSAPLISFLMLQKLWESADLRRAACGFHPKQRLQFPGIPSPSICYRVLLILYSKVRIEILGVIKVPALIEAVQLKNNYKLTNSSSVVPIGSSYNRILNIKECWLWCFDHK